MLWLPLSRERTAEINAMQVGMGGSASSKSREGPILPAKLDLQMPLPTYSLIKREPQSCGGGA